MRDTEGRKRPRPSVVSRPEDLLLLLQLLHLLQLVSGQTLVGVGEHRHPGSPAQQALYDAVVTLALRTRTETEGKRLGVAVSCWARVGSRPRPLRHQSPSA
jgi:hypothetical protein